MKVKVAQLCPSLCDPMDCPWNSTGQNTRVGSLSPLQGIFPTQGPNPGLPLIQKYFTHIRNFREEGGGFRMGNTCIPVADSF